MKLDSTPGTGSMKRLVPHIGCQAVGNHKGHAEPDLHKAWLTASTLLEKNYIFKNLYVMLDQEKYP
jgi:hypothetical protein